MLRFVCASWSGITYLSGRSAGYSIEREHGRAMASTYTGGVALCAHKAHHLEARFAVSHWILRSGFWKNGKIAVSRGARLRAQSAAVHVKKRCLTPAAYRSRRHERHEDGTRARGFATDWARMKDPPDPHPPTGGPKAVAGGDLGRREIWSGRSRGMGRGSMCWRRSWWCGRRRGTRGVSVWAISRVG